MIIDEYEIRTQTISTRLFFVALFVSLITLTIYTSAVPVNTTIIVDWPSYETYSRIYSQYSESLSCPCSNISMRYDEFLDVQAIRFHQICQSVYVTTNWSSLIAAAGFHHSAFFDDFRR